jgi:hypothetical protein
MSKVMSVLGIIMLAFGVAIALLLIVNVGGGRLQIVGTTMDTAAVLIAGGIISIGLGGVIQALYDRMGSVARLPEADPVVPAPIVNKAEVVAEPAPAPAPIFVEPEKPAEVPAPANTARLRFPGFKKVEPAAVVVPAAVVAAEAMTPSVQETIEALEKAKVELSQSVGNIAPPAEVAAPTIPLPPPEVEAPADEPEAEVEPEEVAGEGDLFVVEDKVIRGRPARILSDGTVEAETDEGWMRFENLEHLNEYLDAVQTEE